MKDTDFDRTHRTKVTKNYIIEWKNELKSSTIMEMENEGINHSSRTPNQSNMVIPERNFPNQFLYNISEWLLSSPPTLPYNRNSLKFRECSN